MRENVGEPAKRGIGRWIFLGCAGCGGLVLLSFAGCAGFFYYLYKNTEPIAEVGAVYLRNSPEVAGRVGQPLTVERKAMDWKVQITNDLGKARIGYTVAGSKARLEAIVWLVKARGSWTVQGARVDDVEIGNPPRERIRDSFDWDD